MRIIEITNNTEKVIERLMEKTRSRSKAVFLEETLMFVEHLSEKITENPNQFPGLYKVITDYDLGTKNLKRKSCDEKS